MSNLIFEALVAEAQFRVVEHTTKGVAVDQAISEVAREMELVKEEVDELTTRVKKSPSPKPVVEDEGEEELDMDDIMSGMDSQSAAVDNAIYFSSPDELETAQGVLMYKGIPWLSKGDDYLEFQDGTFVTQAHDALKRRWDFVNQDERTVAVIEFDNIADYEKVLDFIASKNLTVLKGTNDELVSDMDQELSEAEAAYKKAKKDAKETGQPAPEAPSQAMSFKALHKDKLTDVKTLDPSYDNTARCIRVVKRWK